MVHARGIVSLAVAAACVFFVASARSIERDIRGYEVSRVAGGDFAIHYPPNLEPMAREVEAIIVQSAGDIALEIGLDRIAPIEVYLAGDERTYRKLHEGSIPEWSAAFSDVQDRVLGILAPFATSERRPLRNIVRHELSHLLLAQRIGAVHVPTWFAEGLAMMQAQEWSFVDDWNFMILAGRNRIPYLEELEYAFPRSAEDAALAYALSYLAMRTMFSENPELLSTFMSFLRDTGDFEDAFNAVFGTTPYNFASSFYVSIEKKYKLPGAVLDASPYWFVASSLVVIAFVARRIRIKSRLREMQERENALEQGDLEDRRSLQ